MNLLHKKIPFLVTCQDPGQVADSVRSGSVGPYPINSRVTYTCNNCYVGGGTITCQPNGQWTQTVVCRSKLQLLLWSIPIFYQTFHLYIFNVEIVCITYLSNLKSLKYQVIRNIVTFNLTPNHMSSDTILNTS